MNLMHQNANEIFSFPRDFERFFVIIPVLERENLPKLHLAAEVVYDAN